MANIGKVVNALKTKNKESIMEVRTARATKPAKVQIWTNNLRLETYIKQRESWNEVN